MFPKVRFRLRTLLVLVAVSALSAAAYVRWNEPLWASFQEWQRNRPIWRRLNQTVALRHPTGIPLDRFLNSFKPAGLVIYCDPEGLQDANQDIHLIVKIDAPSIKIQDALDETLKPLGLKLIVKGGMARVTGENEDID